MILPSRPRRRVARRLTAAGILLLGLAGCATPQLQALLGSDPPGLPQRVELDAVPFYAQDEYQCGPAALAMVLEAGGKAIGPDALRPQVFVPERQGSLQVEMLAAARRNGFVAMELKPSLSDLLAEIAAGTPVVVLQNLALDWYPVWHYAVAIGYDLKEQQIVLRSGTDRRLEMPLSTFERTWQRSGYWAMLALPPGRFPVSVGSAEYLSAVTKLEKAGPPESAQAAYQSALQRWPDQFTALMGAGNTAYRAGDFEEAERAFRRATVVFPRSVAAHNNLAQTLADLDRHDEALSEARTAVGLGGPLEDTSIRTLDAIVKRTGRGEQEWNK
ncbi:MAG TPA: PA2778 family cysteine peptidase [Burkholderiales bacterium]|nr:PA2778 family cysteine peptidase [Burkholderiales bacterium]